MTDNAKAETAKEADSDPNGIAAGSRPSERESDPHRVELKDHPVVQIVDQPTPWQHVIVWVIGAVLASLVAFAPLLLHGVDNGEAPGFFEMLGRGDLFLISVVLTIGGIAELALRIFTVRPDQRMFVAMVLLGSLVVVVIEAFWYADIASRILDGQKIEAARDISLGSIFFFVLSAASSSACVHVAAGAR